MFFGCLSSIQVDDRLTDEMKHYAKITYNLLRFADRFLSLGIYRKLIDRICDAKMKFDKLRFEEHSVKSLFDDHKIKVTAYVPKNATPNTTIGIFIHGGGFQNFSRKSHHGTVCFIAESTCTIWVSVEYRLSPEFKHPTAIHDCLSVTHWVLENKQALFGSSPESKVGICGDSAGGNLAATVVFRLKSKLDFQILIYPWLDLTCNPESYKEFSKPYCVTNYELVKKTAADYLGDSNAADASPLFETDFDGLPRTLMVLAEFDSFNAEGLEYFEKLKGSSIPCSMGIVKGTLHGFFFNTELTRNAFLNGMDYVIEFLK
jgi:acetyl esterase